VNKLLVLLVFIQVLPFNGFSDFQIQTEEPGKKNFFLQVLNLGSGLLNHEWGDFFILTRCTVHPKFIWLPSSILTAG
jgi:hypothetical protein